MHNTTKRALVLLGFAVAFLVGVVILIVTFVVNSNTWATHSANQHLYNRGNIISAGKVYDADGKVLAKSEDGVRSYYDDSLVRKATLHTVGDTDGNISTGVQTIFQSELTGYSIVNGVYYLKQNTAGNDITLTLKSDVCATAYEALNGHKGTIGVYNYKQGNIVCMVSAPSYDPENKPSQQELKSDDYEGVYLNRFLSGTYTPGSTFKVITAASAIQNIPDIYTQTFNCTGRYNIAGSDSGVTCTDTHGSIGFESGLNHSCNSVFASIALQLGETNLKRTAEELGICSSFEVDRVKIEKGSLGLDDVAPIDLGWAGIGQHKDMVNPCMMMCIMGAIANKGKAVKPYFVDNVKNSSGTVTYSHEIPETVSEINMSSELASALFDLLRSDVENYYGDWQFPGLEMCGKTGTAEVVGHSDTALFAGFSADESFPYAIVVVMEDSQSTGYSTAIPIANTVLQALK